uniref:Lysozyme g n=1 Tax=Meleagris gallopavo TaxID=9103 RepID=G1NPK5_MELGA
PLGCSNFYGNIANVETTGASERTAKPEGLGYAGGCYLKTITKVANSKCVSPSVVAAVISRESHAGTALKDGWGDHGNAFGLMQIDKRYHQIHGAWNSEEHIKQGTDILCQSINDIQKKFPTWSKEQQLKGGISAYNAGTRNVRTYEGMDVGTTHNDYANDVVARAKFFQRHGY